jgi:Bacterial Ig-like domain (group 3)/FG-GAP-like repeat/FG-GAP repeat
MRLLPCRFAAVLPILTFSVLALAQGTTPSQTQLLPSASSTAGQVGFAVHVRPGASIQPPFTAPTGRVTLYNGATAVGQPATLSAESGITSATFAQSFGTPDATVAKAAAGAVWGDFNEDGLPDLLVYGNAPGPVGQALVVQDFLSSATSLQNGTTPPFTVVAMQQLALPLQTQYGETLAVLDVDGDGHLDLLAGNTVAYGKGDGTFGRVEVLPALATGYDQTYAVDIDGDGKLDIVAVDTPPATLAPGTVQYGFTVFHNAGGGSFTTMGPLAPSFAAGSDVFYNIFGLSFADVNGDGRIDVLSQSNAVPLGTATQPANLNVMLNLGTGFSAPKTIDTSAIPDLGMVSIAFADLNNDGKQDLAFSYQANTMNNGVATLLGNGDGTFAAPVNFTIGNTLTVGSSLLPLVTEDFNADGKADVVLGSGVLLLGNGDGTLTAGTPLFTSNVALPNPPPAYAVLTAPPTGTIPGWGSAPLSVLFFINLQAGANAVFLPNIGSGATASAALAPGTYSLTAHYSGDATYAPSVSNAFDVTIAPVAPKVTVTSSANPSYTGEAVTITATISGLFGPPSGSVVFSDGSTALGTVQVSNGVASYKGSFSTAGSHTITAAYSGDASNLAASGTLAQTVDAPIAIGNGSGGSTTLTVTAGQAATTQVSVSGAAGFNGTVDFSCTGLPMYAACSFAPASVTVSGTTAATTTLTISTAATTMASVHEAESSRTLKVLACGLPLLGLLTLLPVARGRRLLLCVGFALFVSMTSLTGCGGSSGGAKTAAGTYTFNVMATSGSATSTATYKLTVE